MKKFIMIVWCICLFIGAPLLLAQDTSPEATPEASVPARQSVVGTISGAVTLGTQGIALPPDSVATLIVFDPVAQVERLFETTIDAQNRYRFEGVDIVAGDFYFVSVTYDGRNYGTSPISGDPLFPNMDMPVTVYATTSNSSVIQIRNIVTQIQPSQGLLQFTQVVQIRNTSDHLYIGIPMTDDFNATIEISLPIGAGVIDLIQSERFAVDQTAFTITDTRPVFPEDDHLIIVTYLMPYEQDAVIEFPINYRFEGQMRVLVSTDELNVLQFASMGKQQLGDKEYTVYGVDVDLMPGDSIRYDLNGRVAGVGGFIPNTTATGTPSNVISGDTLPLVMVIIFVVIAVITIGVASVMNRRKPILLHPTDEDDASEDDAP